MSQSILEDRVCEEQRIRNKREHPEPWGVLGASKRREEVKLSKSSLRSKGH